MPLKYLILSLLSFSVALPGVIGQARGLFRVGSTEISNQPLSAKTPEFYPDAPIGSIYGAAYNPTGDPIGGGNGYRRTVNVSEATCTATDATSLDVCWSTATSTPGTIIFINTDTLDYSGKGTVVIPRRTTLAGGRGYNNGAGAVLKMDTIPRDGMAPSLSRLFVARDSIRITGLQVIGPAKEYGGGNNVFMTVDGYTLVEIDNCTFTQWGRIVQTRDLGDQIYVHHNIIDKTGPYPIDQGQGTIGGSYSHYIYANKIDGAWHVVGSNGWPSHCIFAAYNEFTQVLYGWTTSNHIFDAHAWNDARNIDNIRISGDTASIKYNTFKVGAGISVADAVYYNHDINLRGFYNRGVSVFGNSFTRKDTLWGRNNGGTDSSAVHFTDYRATPVGNPAADTFCNVIMGDNLFDNTRNPFVKLETNHNIPVIKLAPGWFQENPSPSNQATWYPTFSGSTYINFEVQLATQYHSAKAIDSVYVFVGNTQVFADNRAPNTDEIFWNQVGNKQWLKIWVYDNKQPARRKSLMQYRFNITP